MHSFMVKLQKQKQNNTYTYKNLKEKGWVNTKHDDSQVEVGGKRGGKKVMQEHHEEQKASRARRT